jgi:hypothetical protein
MRKLTLLLALLAGGGCLPMRPPQPVDDEVVVDHVRLGELFGDVPIIRPGMSENEVDRLMGPGGPGYSPSAGRSISSDGTLIEKSWFYECGLFVHMKGLNVENCRWKSPSPLGLGQKPSIDDAKVGTLLQSGLTPKEVEERIGPPICGYCNKPGEVCLLYLKPGIAVDYVDGRHLRWHRVVAYKDEPAPKS